MDFKLDAFPVDDNTGGIRSTEKIRIIICYVLRSCSGVLSKDDLLSALYDNGIANYFELCQAVDDLLEVNAISTVDNRLIINDNGIQIARDLENELSLFIRNKAVRAVKLTALYEKRKRENIVSVTKTDDGKLRLDITLLSAEADSESSEELLKVSVYATDSQQAETMKSTFLNNPVRLYESVIQALTEESQFKE